MLPATVNNTVNLLPHQTKHVEKIWGALIGRGEFAICDSSKTGVGKTHTSLYIAQKLQKLYNLKIVIVAPNVQSLRNDDGWENWAKRYDIVIERATTYAALRSKNEEWLYKDNINGKKGYHASPKFNSLAQEGIFIIFDEFHMATRESSTHYACAALIRACYRNNTRCRVALLSLTPGDKIEHYVQIMRLLGLIRHTTLYKYDRSTREYDWVKYGFGEMIHSCVVRGTDINALLNDFGRLSGPRIKYLIGYFYERYIKERICFAMPIPENTNKVTTRNCFLECYKPDLENLNNAIDRLCEGAGWNGFSIDEKKEWNIGQINIALKLIERYKLRTIAKYIKKRSLENPNKKFVVSMGSRCTEHFSMMKEILSSQEVTIPIGIEIMLKKARKDRFNVWSRLNKDLFNLILGKAYKPKIDIMHGETSVDTRIKTLRRFQSPGSDCWCLLISPGVGDKSISLQDIHGNSPRELILLGDFYHTRLTQSCGRVDRVGVASDVEVSIIYCKEARLETIVIKSMVTKSIIASGMLAVGQSHRFPGQYDIWVEKDQENKVRDEIVAKW